MTAHLAVRLVWGGLLRDQGLEEVVQVGRQVFVGEVCVLRQHVRGEVVVLVSEIITSEI